MNIESVRPGVENIYRSVLSWGRSRKRWSTTARVLGGALTLSVLLDCDAPKVIPDTQVSGQASPTAPESVNSEKPWGEKVRGEAMRELQGHGVTGVTELQVLPSGTQLKFVSTITEVYLYPDELSKSRFVKQTGEGSGIGMPVGSPENLVKVDLPAEANMFYVKRWGQKHPDGPRVLQEWIFIHPQSGQRVRLGNVDDSWSVEADAGPLSFLIGQYAAGESSPLSERVRVILP